MAHIFNANVNAKWMAKMLVGYARVSTDGQSVADQIAALKAAGAVKVYSEKMSGARSEPPAQRIERDFPRAMIAPDDQQVLGRRGVPPRRIIVNAAVPNVHAINNGVSGRPAALDYPSAHRGRCNLPLVGMPRRRKITTALRHPPHRPDSWGSLS
jgi:hypothetical protein